jgi:tRNA(fMet)-specific endonuclease VapC
MKSANPSMIRTMLDTNVCINVIRNRMRSLGQRFQDEIDFLGISSIVVHELRYGAEKSDRPAYHHERAYDFCTRLTILDFDSEAAAHAAEIKNQLRQQGNLIGPNDLLIAGHARSLGVKLITGNLREFTRVEGLRCEDWFAA